MSVVYSSFESVVASGPVPDVEDHWRSTADTWVGRYTVFRPALDVRVKVVR